MRKYKIFAGLMITGLIQPTLLLIYMIISKGYSTTDGDWYEWGKQAYQFTALFAVIGLFLIGVILYQFYKYPMK